MIGLERTANLFRLDKLNQCGWLGSEQVTLSPKAFAVLLYLVERPGRLVTKQELLDAVWPDTHVTEGVLKRAVLEIRKALDDSADEPRFVQTLHRRGYRFLVCSDSQHPEPAGGSEPNGFIGRSMELSQLDAWFEGALGERRQVVFVTGEAGVGKTMLLDYWIHSLETRLTSTGVAVARGRCLQQSAAAEPYMPVFEALEHLSRQIGKRLVDTLRCCAPTWLLHMPGLISPSDRATLLNEVFHPTRERMLREITDALELLSREIPLVLVLEDLHWSDSSTLDLLSSIARRTSPARLLILANYRPADAALAHSPLFGAQNELELHGQCEVLPIDSFSEAETSEYLATRISRNEGLEALAASIQARTNGNPLYISMIVDELTENEIEPAAIAQMLPQTLQYLFERQVAQLSGREQELVRAAAVASQSFGISAVSEALGWDEAEAEAICDALSRRQVILEPAEEGLHDAGLAPRYGFIHALGRDAICKSVPAGRCARLRNAMACAEQAIARPAKPFVLPRTAAA